MFSSEYKCLGASADAWTALLVKLSTTGKFLGTERFWLLPSEMLAWLPVSRSVTCLLVLTHCTTEL